MAAYELVIEERQPTCGGKSPTKSRILSVETEDPVAYVQALEPECELEVFEENGALVVKTEHNGMWIKYEFEEA